MMRFVRTASPQVLAAFLIMGTIAITPDTVLCVGPSGHCHLEIVAGASCGEQVLMSPSAAPSDGCPRGSKDFKFGSSARRGDKSALVGAFTPVLVVGAARLGLHGLSHTQYLPQVARGQESKILAVILRC